MTFAEIRKTLLGEEIQELSSGQFKLKCVDLKQEFTHNSRAQRRREGWMYTFGYP